MEEGTVTDINGQKVAVYKNNEGKLVTISATCTHKGCTVGWNSKDNTWDCPCHGARFSKEGKVIKGPATKDLLSVIS